ncbi:MAG: CFI-box-CTERM domain-containing protein [Bdellovibrionota bacterium]
MADTNTEVSCPRCGSTVSTLTTIDTGMRLALQKATEVASLPGQVCDGCYSELTSKVSQGMKLRMEQVAREKNRTMMWKSRVNLVKQARQLMQLRAFPEAAINYEKYIRVLEISFDVKAGQLKPDIFGKSARSKELTVISTVYWDLLRIYDTNPAYRDRMVVAGKKLAEFLPFSPIFPDVVTKAHAFLPTARNPDIVKTFLRDSKALRGRCFVATAAFEDTTHPTVAALRNFRDTHLLKSNVGVRFVIFYYNRSPKWATWLEQHPKYKKVSRHLLTALVKTLQFFS